MCSRGETGFKRWLFGSVAQEVALQSPVPVLVLNERGAPLPTLHTPNTIHALVALDGSPQSEAVLEPAAQFLAALAGPCQGLLHLLHVVDLPLTEGKWRSQAHVDAIMRAQARQEAETYLKAVVNRLQKGSLAEINLTVTSSVIVSPDVAGTIIKQAEHPGGTEQEGDCMLIALTTYERKGLLRLLMGSVTERVLRSTRLPLLVVRPQEKSGRAHVQAKERKTPGVGGN